MLTIMGIAAEQHGVELGKVKVSVDKTMSADSPRRIVKLEVGLAILSDFPKRKTLENAALACPVHHSLHPDIEQVVRFGLGRLRAGLHDDQIDVRECPWISSWRVGLPEFPDRFRARTAQDDVRDAVFSGE